MTSANYNKRGNVDDDYFNKDDDILAVYDYDYEKVIDFNYRLGQRSLCCIASVIPHCWPILPCVVGYIYSDVYQNNVVDLAEAQHIALSRDGIKYIVETHKTGCRLDCQDVGKVSKTVPYDKITDCDVESPAGASGPFCCMVQNVLTKVNVDTASGNRGSSGGTGPAHELVLVGLKDPEQFKKDVWSMNRGDGGIASSPYYSTNTNTTSVAPSTFIMDRPTTVASATSPGTEVIKGGDNNEMLALMREQNALLKQQNQLLQDVLDDKRRI